MKLKTLTILASSIIFASTSLIAATTLKVTLQLPLTHSLGENWTEFKNIVEKESNGEIKVIIFPSAQLYKDKQVPQAVGSGAIEAGSAFIGRFAGSVPSVDVVSIPFLFKNTQQLTKAVSNGSKMRNIIDARILEETGAKVLWWQAFGRNVYLNNDKAVINPSDLKGKKIRSYGKIQGWTAQELGAVPTLMSGSKQFLAYQQGTVDAGMTGLSAVKSRKIYEVMKHVTVTGDSAIEFVAIINNKVFEGLSSKNKTIVLNAASKVEKNLRAKVYSNEDAIAVELEKKMTVTRLTDSQRAVWEKQTIGVRNKFIKNVGKIGQDVVDAATMTK